MTTPVDGLARNAELPIWVCVSGLIHDDTVFRHGETYRASEIEGARRDQAEAFIPWPARPKDFEPVS